MARGESEADAEGRLHGLRADGGPGRLGGDREQKKVFLSPCLPTENENGGKRQQNDTPSLFCAALIVAFVTW